MYRKRITLFVISILLLAALFYTLDYNEFFRITSRLSLRWITALVILQLVIMFLMTLKWYVVIRRYAVSFINVLYASLIGFMVNNLTPMSQAGGEAIRAYVISRIDKIKMEKAFATVFVDLFLTVIPILLLNLIAILLVFKYSADLRIAWLLIFLGLLILALIVTSFNILTNREPSLKLFNRLLDLLGRVRFLAKYVKRVESRVDELFGSFHRGIRDTMTDMWTLTVGILISSLTWVLSLLRVYLIFLALGVPVEFDVVVIVYAVLVNVGMLPLLPGALGMWEWVSTGLFTFFGIPMEAAVAVTLVDRLLFYWLPLFTGFLSSLHVGLNVMRLVERQE
jgi:uncharacterized protein (TIRG00374 family)